MKEVETLRAAAIVCPYLEGAISIEPDKSFRLCCYSQDTRSLIDANSNTLFLNDNEPIPFNKIKIARQKAKDQFNKGIWPKSCSSCMNLEQNGGASPRTNALKDNLVNLSTNEVSYLDISFGNFCNLKCRSCSPYFSSSLMSEFSKLEILIDNEKVERAISFSQKLPFALLNYNWDNCKSLSLQGGEPMIIPAVSELLNYLVQRGKSKNIQLTITTNLTTLDYSKLLLLEEFKSISISISMDSIERRYEYLRFPAKWDVFKKNLDLLTAYQFKNINHLSVMTVLSAYNVLSIDLIFDFLKTYNNSLSMIPYFVVLQNPAYMHLSAVPLLKRIDFCQRLEKNEILRVKLKPILKMIKELPFNQELEFDFYLQTKKTDTIRNQKLLATFPEFIPDL